MSEKDYFITSIPLIEIQGCTSIPTVLFYDRNDKALIGTEAKAAAELIGREVLNEDFKIDLGNDNPSQPYGKRKFQTASGVQRSAGDLTGEFFHQIIKYINNWLPQKEITNTEGIVVAEPLPMSGNDVDESWLKNYRSNIKRILLGKGFDEKQIDFMPEPFAVFQYYKYGLKHPYLSDHSKQNVLVIDFGGGSFDVCIITTDKEGEITTKRQNTKPMAASSAPVGGYYVNRMIAEFLFFKYARDDKRKRTELNKGLELYNDWKKNKKDLSFADKRFQNFVRTFHKSVYDIEDAKITLCNSISDWDLESSLLDSVPIKLPEDPFSENSHYFTAVLTIKEFKDIFEEKVWKTKLQQIIKTTIQRGREELSGEPITIVLLSGGSCNIRWLDKLIERDFYSSLSEAQILQLEHNFQEVVSKGLAIECTRRLFNVEKVGDFSSVTYNRLHLVLSPDEQDYELKNYRPTDNNPIPETNKPCVLIPSASVMLNHFDKPLRWRVRLNKPPRKFLDYYFLRAGFNPLKEKEPNFENALTSESGDYENIYGETSDYSDDLINLDHRIHTPPNCRFDSNIVVEIVLGKDSKTARVKFIYACGTNEREPIFVDGSPFYIDMTDTQYNPKASAYIGVDFGTSNTSVSYVSESSVRIYQKRRTEKQWLDLSELHKTLPFPLALPLAKYLSEIDENKRISLAREFAESALALAAYISYLEMCTLKDRKPKSFFKSFNQRSIGLLWGFLKSILTEIKDDAQISTPYLELTSEAFKETIDKQVSFLAKLNHSIMSNSEFNSRIVNILANISQKMFSTYKFGYFENVHMPRFRGNEYKGIFRQASGSNTHFNETIEYTGSALFPNRMAYLVNFNSRKALNLCPLMFWYSCKQHPDDEHYFFYDKADGRSSQSENFIFKAAGFHCTLEAPKSDDELEPIANDIMNFRNLDPVLSLIEF